MIVDDDETDRYLLKRTLKKENIEGEIFEATNGKEALDFLTNIKENIEKYGDDFPPILIFLDINMPIMGGFEFLEEYSKFFETKKDYISSVFTMYTSSEREEDKQKVSSYDFVKGYIVKGDMNSEKLNSIIDECIS